MPLQPTISHEAKVLEIAAAAMQATMQGKAHVFVSYAGHVNMINVYAKPVETKYQAPDDSKTLFSESCFLELGHVDKQLEAILAKIKAL